MGNILHAIAYNAVGALIQATDAIKGEAYRCPGCNGALIPRRSAEQKKGAKRPHFAHKVRTPDCEPESVLHFGFKRLLVERLRDLITRNEPMPVQWQCTACDRQHQGNLLKKAIDVREEHDLGACRPDIALLDAKGRTVWALEVVVTHRPVTQALDHYRMNNIGMARFDLRSDEDLAKAMAPVLAPDVVEQCANPRCPKCRHFQRNTVLWIMEGGCYKCGCVIKVAAVEGGESRGSTYAGPDQFTFEEREIAEAKGCVFQEHYSRTARERYLANTCPHCGAFVGRHYLFTEFVSVAGAYGLAYEKIDVGHHCAFCDEELLWAEEEGPDDLDVEPLVERALGPSLSPIKEGYCIRCRTPIVKNAYRPMCNTCFRKERIRANLGLEGEPEQRYCLRCGDQHPTTRWKPYCPACYVIAEWK